MVAAVDQPISLRWVVRCILQFGAVSVTQGGLSLLIVPLLSRVLSSAALGEWALVEAILALAPGLATLGAHHHILRLRPFSLENERTSARSIQGGGALAALGTSLIGMLALLPFFGGMVSVLLGANMAVDAVLIIEQFRSRGNGDATGYARTTIIRLTVFLIVVAAMSLFIERMGLSHVLLARLGAGLLLALPPLRASLRITVHSKRLRVAVRYGLPIALAAAALQLFDLVERVILTMQVGTEEVGVYYVHAKIASVLGLAFVTPVAIAFPPIRRALLDKAAVDQSRWFSLFQIGVAGVGLGFTSFLVSLTPELLALVAPRALPDRTVAAGLLLGTLLKGVSAVFSVGLYSSTGSKEVLRAAMLAITVDMVLGAVLTSIFGLKGMAVASCIAATCYLLWISNRSYRLSRLGFGSLAVSVPLLMVNMLLVAALIRSHP